MEPSITSVPPDPNPTIKVIFQGLVLAHLEGQAAQVAAINSDPCHRPKISVTRFENGKYVNEINLARLLGIEENKFVDDFHLYVLGTSQSGISKFQVGEFDRTKPDDSDRKHDFRWFIDIEKDIFKVAEPVPVNHAKIGRVFHVQNAVFYSEGPSKNDCLIKRADEEAKPFGHIAEAVCANIQLDQPESQASLKSGEREIVALNAGDVEAGVRYEILFDCDCDNPAVKVSDFRFVIEALDIPATQENKINLERTEKGVVDNHEVPCGGGGSGSPLP